jgi:microcystin-dependent protein
LVAPVGIIMYWTNSTAPSGWLVCDGSAVSRTTYADLFAVVGTTFGEGDGSTTYNLPALTTPEKFIRCDTNPDPVGGGSDDAVVVKHTHIQDSHSHYYSVSWASSGFWPIAASGNRSFRWRGTTDSKRPEIHETGVDGTEMNMPAYIELVPIIKY